MLNVRDKCFKDDKYIAFTRETTVSTLQDSNPLIPYNVWKFITLTAVEEFTDPPNYLIGT